MSVLQKNEVLAILRYHKPRFSEQYGVTDLGVFGSVARDEAHPDSDVDIVVRMREPKLFFMVHIKDVPRRSISAARGHRSVPRDDESVPEKTH